MKNKGIYAENALPLYEVTELTEYEAQLAISDYTVDKTRYGMLSSEILKRYYADSSADQPRKI
jgi:hypothetical protein